MHKLSYAILLTALTAACLGVGAQTPQAPIPTAPQVTTPRSRSTVEQFHKLTGHPNGWAGHVVDHMIPLCAGGPDAVTNMKWQTVAEGLVKDGFERELCNAMRKEGYVIVKGLVP